MNEVNEMSSTVLDAVATTSSTVLQQPSTKLVVLTIINSVLLLAIILLIAVLIRLKKSGKQLIFNIGFGNSVIPTVINSATHNHTEFLFYGKVFKF